MTESTTAMDPKAADGGLGDELAGMYLTFKVGEETYGLSLLKVREIIGLLDITRVPRTIPSLKGVMNLRGKVIPVVSLRVLFGMPEVEDTEETCVVVVEMGDEQMGVIVDAVSEVLDLKSDQICPPPEYGAQNGKSRIQGVGKLEDRVVMLMGVDAVLAIDDFSEGAAAAL